ncbi:MAG: YlxR family protein [Mariprofundus sp.]
MICRASYPKQEMLRLVVDGDGEIWPDVLQKAPGRGVYHCMREACLTDMNDKRLQSLKVKFRVNLPQQERVRERIVNMLEQQLKRMFTRQCASAAIGRDAVMHRLWNNMPLLLLRASDAGSALVRQLDDGLEKRAGAGMTSVLTTVPSRQWLGGMCGRDDVAVVAMDAAGMAAAMVNRLNVYCVWLARITGCTKGTGR